MDLSHIKCLPYADTYPNTHADTNADAYPNTNAYPDTNADAHAHTNSDSHARPWPGQACTGRLLAQLYEPERKYLSYRASQQ
ncbi:hypothetical protein UNDKW_0616 [Undibacterium sp. KW1]|nr:hypothetical protein UNDKW_0616 [Undibacterium sp. KW1]